MIDIKNNPMREPIGGYRFVEGEHVILADSFLSLVAKLTDYRVMNGKPIGQPRKEILLHIQRTAPYLIRETGESEKREPGDENYLDWQKFISNLWKSPHVKVLTPKEAGLRWEACRYCPHNQPKDWVPTKEANELSRRAFLLRQGLEVPKYLGFCSLHRAEIAVLSFIANCKKQLNDPNTCNSRELPSNCWIET